MLLEMGKNNPLKPDDYSKISAPSLILLGDNDKMIPQEETIAVHKVLTGSQFKILSNTGHAIEQVNTKLLAGLIEDFVK
jgi:pimeloyl-ACP methyl ester carboxylesterase